MRLSTAIRTLTLAALVMSPIQALHAQTLDAQGHYEGTISSPAGGMSLQIDLMKAVNGEMAGTLTIPAQKLKGFPLSNVVVKGRDVSFDIAASGGSYFRGELADGRISGDFSTQMGPLPLSLQRNGEVHIYAPPSGSRIGNDLEGVWNGTLDVDGGMRVALKLANQPDGTSSGSFVSVDENNLTMPLGITQDGLKVTLDLAMVGSSYVGNLNAAGTEMTGTFTTSRGIALPLSLKRSATN